jgi:hypothetical protein
MKINDFQAGKKSMGFLGRQKSIRFLSAYKQRFSA